MNQFSRPAYGAGALDTSVDAGLRSFMLGVYNKMALGLLVSGALAFIIGSAMIPALTAAVLSPPLIFVIQFGPIALLFGSMFFMRNPSPMGSAVFVLGDCRPDRVGPVGLGRDGHVWRRR